MSKDTNLGKKGLHRGNERGESKKEDLKPVDEVYQDEPKDFVIRSDPTDVIMITVRASERHLLPESRFAIPERDMVLGAPITWQVRESPLLPPGGD